MVAPAGRQALRPGSGQASAGRRRGGALLAGLAGGAVSGLIGVGGGVIMVPVLTGVVWLSQHRAHGTSLAVVTFAALAGGAPYWFRGEFDGIEVAALGTGSVMGAVLGARLMTRIRAAELRLLFALFIFAASIRMLVG